MLSLILTSALATAATASVIDKAEMSKISCYIIDDWTIFDLRDLENSDHDYKSGDLTFNFCRYTDWPSGQLIRHADTFAYILDPETNFATPITNGAYLPQDVTVKKDSYDNRWVQFT